MFTLVIKIVTILTATLPRLTLSRLTVITPALNSSIVTPNSPLTPIGAIIGGIVSGIGKQFSHSYIIQPYYKYIRLLQRSRPWPYSPRLILHPLRFQKD